MTKYDTGQTGQSPTGQSPTGGATHRANGTSAFEEHYFTARDGLQLHARYYPAARTTSGPARRPAVCIPGITRNSRDFHTLALALANDERRARAVYALDLRGRGKSAHDPDPKNYSVPVETGDVLDFLISRSLSRVALIGTSRGGLIAMAMAAVEPQSIGVAVLNDIGPVIEIDGLSRIAGYVGKMPQPLSWADAARIVKEVNSRQFPRLTESDWLEIARQLFDDKAGRPVIAYDTKIAMSLSVLDGKPPELWPQFEALKPMPVLCLRGENSDLLSTATLEEMQRRHPKLTAHTVRWEGHAPWLRDEHTIEVIAGFLADTD